MATKSHKGRKPLGREPFAHVAFAITPTASDAIDTLANAGRGTRSSIARTFIETGLESGAIETFAEDAAENEGGYAEGDPTKARKAGPWSPARRTGPHGQRQHDGRARRPPTW